MSEMINRVAEALCYAKPVTFEDMARAAITAMREPTEAMVDRGLSEPRGEMDWRKAVAVGWRAMIDEALR